MHYFASASQDLVDALKALSTFFTDNSLRERRNLRGDIEKRSLYINEQFESAFREVKEVNTVNYKNIKGLYRTLFDSHSYSPVWLAVSVCYC